MPAIEVSHLTKTYRLGAMQGLKQSVLNAGARLIGRPVAQRPMFKALDDVSFSVEVGEVVGIIGHNGAGKSTLLKMLARISTPTMGTVEVRGRVAPLIEVGAGFVPDFTGRENVYLNARILGMSKKEIDLKFDEIVDFAEMAEFIDTPVKRYSSGMQVKLAFAVATSIESEILIVDEVLAVGDLAFQRKCIDRMHDLIKREGRTVLLVSHNIRQVERLCTRAILMDHGRIACIGAPTDVCNEFYARSDETIKNARQQSNTKARRETSSNDIALVDIQIRNADNVLTENLRPLQGATFDLVFDVFRDVPNPIFGFGFHTTDFVYLATTQSLNHIDLPALQPGRYSVRYHLKRMPLLPGVYAIRVGVALGDAFQAVFYVENAARVRVVDETMNRAALAGDGEGFVHLEGQWQLLGNNLDPVLESPSMTEPAIQA